MFICLFIIILLRKDEYIKVIKIFVLDLITIKKKKKKNFITNINI